MVGGTDAALLIPIAASLATSLGINPLLLMAPVAIATSYGFIMPVGTPPNAIVYSSGYITAREMSRAELPLVFISNSNGNNINEYISSSSFWNWINDISKKVKSYFFIFIT